MGRRPVRTRVNTVVDMNPAAYPVDYNVESVRPVGSIPCNKVQYLRTDDEKAHSLPLPPHLNKSPTA